MSIIGRAEERRKLEQCECSQKSELVCVYGRRRVGKTYLIEQTFADFFAEYEKSLLKKMDTYRAETNSKRSLKLVLICAEELSGRANTEHITRVLTLKDLFQ